MITIAFPAYIREDFIPSNLGQEFVHRFNVQFKEHEYGWSYLRLEVNGLDDLLWLIDNQDELVSCGGTLSIWKDAGMYDDCDYQIEYD